ncbi:MAG: 50S ribosomal protein L11 methyltransferase [Candidatus Lambdaproteobacteria bacterium]|nr:50S ribosomal protein L11 methyltransferase [Candidatus Lambdaproteobacteria bacterium]
MRSDSSPGPDAPATLQPVPERYWVLDAALPPGGEDLWSLFCFEQGATGAETLGEDETGLHQRHFFAAPPCREVSELVRAFAAAYPAAPPPHRVNLADRVVEDWAAAWRSHFAPTPVGETLLVCPPWDVPAGSARDGRRALVINPGQGFGTGAHATTWLALALLERRLAMGPPPSALLDVGTGSGILALAGGLRGVRDLWALDVDAVVMPEVAANAALNSLPRPRRVVGGPGCLARDFALVCANIVSPVLLAECAHLVRRTAPGGTLVLSGVLQAERAQVLAAYSAAGMVLLEQAVREEWWAGLLRRSSL